MTENPRRFPAGSRDAVKVVRTWKARTVFAHAHALFFVLAACGGYPEYLLRPAQLDVVRRKETRKILTDDLLVRATCHSLRAGIPSANLALRTQHKDGVVLDPLNQRPIFAFAFLQRLLGDLAPRVVALDDPAGGDSDQQAQDGSEDQNNFSMACASLARPHCAAPTIDRSSSCIWRTIA